MSRSAYSYCLSIKDEARDDDNHEDISEDENDQMNDDQPIEQNKGNFITYTYREVIICIRAENLVLGPMGTKFFGATCWILEP